MSLQVKTEESEGGRHRITLAGRLDTSTAPELDRQMQPILEGSPNLLVFELGNLDYVSSAGLRVIFKAKKKVRSCGGNTFLVNLQPHVRKVFDIVQATKDLSIFNSVEELDEYLDHIQTGN